MIFSFSSLISIFFILFCSFEWKQLNGRGWDDDNDDDVKDDVSDNNNSFSKYSSDRYKQSPNYFNEYITSMGNGHGIDESSSSSQLSHVIKDIQNLNISK